MGEHNSNWHLNIFSTLRDYRTSIKIATGFTPFQLVYGLEVVLPIECEIPSLKIAIKLFPNTLVEEEHFIYLTNLDEMRQDVALANESHKKFIEEQYDRLVQHRVFNEGYPILKYDQKHEKLGKEKFESMWYGPYVVSKVLEKGAYELAYYDGIPFGKPHNGLYLKIYYA